MLRLRGKMTERDKFMERLNREYPTATDHDKWIFALVWDHPILAELYRFCLLAKIGFDRFMIALLFPGR